MARSDTNSLLISTVICPRCHAELDAQADTCTRCGSSLKKTGRLQTTAAQHQQRIVDRPWFILIVLLHLGVLGIPYYVQTRHSLSTRVLLCLASLAYTVFAVVVIYWGIMQIVRAFSA